jgi:hypothetical protein
MEEGEYPRIEFPVVDKSNFKDFIKTGLALAAIVLWSALTVENANPDYKNQPLEQRPMPSPPAVIRD